MPDVPSKAQDDPINLPGPTAREGEEKSLSRPSIEKPPEPDDKPGCAHAPRNPIFTDLVQGEEDLPGIVGYALYKLSKRDWLSAFVKTHGREPTQDEMESYILGEHTQRRIATYRRLAEELIARKTAVAEKPASPPPAIVSDTPPPRVVAGHSLRSSLAGEASNGIGARPSSNKAVDNGRPRRSGATTLIFWLLVLVVLVVLGLVYWKNPSVLHALTG